jgi:dUTP pyrophosphatase
MGEEQDRRTRNESEIGWTRRFDTEGNVTHAGPILALKVKRLRPDAKLPTRATSGSGGLDLYTTDPLETEARDWTWLRTGVALEIPRGHVGLVRSRSGPRSYSVFHGTIDSDFRGELMVAVRANRDWTSIQAGDRIAQLVIVPVPEIEIVEVEELSETERGEAGFGSTGSR